MPVDRLMACYHLARAPWQDGKLNISKKRATPREWPAKSGRKRPLEDLWDQAAAWSIGEKGKPRLSATAL